MLSQPKYIIDIEKRNEDELHAHTDIKGVKFVPNVRRTEYTWEGYVVKALEDDCFGYKWAVHYNGASIGSFYKLANAKRYCVECGK